VIEGGIVIHTDHYEPLPLQKGDSCYFDSTMGHALVSAGDSDAVILWVCSTLFSNPEIKPDAKSRRKVAPLS
jgi:uncharacterized cupin superfamily protein